MRPFCLTAKSQPCFPRRLLLLDRFDVVYGRMLDSQNVYRGAMGWSTPSGVGSAYCLPLRFSA